jgi:hypothetical protein
MNLQDAIDQWRDCANSELYSPKMREVCERTAVALEIERDTGVAVCSCCHKPLGDKGTMDYILGDRTAEDSGSHCMQ